MVRLRQRLEALRNERKLSLEEMASGAGFLGVGFLRGVERGEFLPSMSTVERLARALKVDPIDLLNLPEEGLRHLLIDLTRHLSQEALAELVEEAERLLAEQKQ